MVNPFVLSENYVASIQTKCTLIINSYAYIDQLMYLYKNRAFARCTSFVPVLTRQRLGSFLSLNRDLSTHQVPGQPGLHRETLTQKK